MILGLWPEAVPFDPSDAEPPVLDSFVSGPAAALTAVTLLAGPAAHASGWAGAAAVAVARAWPGGRRVVLADLSLAEPRLHEVLAVSGDEGVVDVVDYGVSTGRATVTIDDGRFDFLPAGLYAPDPAATLESPAWSGIIDQLAGRGATLLAYLPADAPGAAAFLERTAVLLLVEPHERDAVAGSLRRPYGVMGVLVPPAPVGTEPGLAEPVVEAAAAGAVVAAVRSDPVAGAGAARLSDAEFDRIRLPKDRAARDTLIADLRERQRAARMAPAPDAPVRPAAVPGSSLAMPAGSGDAAVELRLEGAADDVPLDVLDPAVLVPAPPRPPARRARERGHSMTWTVFVVLAVSILAGAWHFLAGRLAPVAPVAAPVVEAPPPAPVVPTALALPWVVVVEVHRDVAAAVGRVDALATAAAPVAFHVAPVELDGTLFYHVMAGPLADSAGAVVLRDSLIAGGHKTGATPTDVRATPLSFLVGEYSTREAADLQLRELARLDMPGYRIDAQAADGQPLHRIYVGGFSSAAEADVIRQMLRSAGIRDTLVTRTGSSIQ